MSDLSGYKNIFKTTFLFGFVQVFNIFVKVGINKVVAILLGTAGMGVISFSVRCKFSKRLMRVGYKSKFHTRHIGGSRTR